VRVRRKLEFQAVRCNVAISVLNRGFYSWQYLHFGCFHGPLVFPSWLQVMDALDYMNHRHARYEAATKAAEQAEKEAGKVTRALGTSFSGSFSGRARSSGHAVSSLSSPGRSDRGSSISFVSRSQNLLALPGFSASAHGANSASADASAPIAEQRATQAAAGAPLPPGILNR
jgi:hypothetical protein